MSSAPTPWLSRCPGPTPTGSRRPPAACSPCRSRSCTGGSSSGSAPKSSGPSRGGATPRKNAPAEDGRIHPRRSFEAWQETVRLKAAPWRPSEVEAANDLRKAILEIVLRRAEERAQLSAELERSNKELEAFSYSVSHDLRAPFRHIIGYAELLREEEESSLSAEGKRYLATIVESAQFAGTLVDNLLAFSRMGRTSIHPVPINMDSLTHELIREVQTEIGPGRSVAWQVGHLPEVEGDIMMLRLAMTNLISNAVKYTRKQPAAIIEIAGSIQGGEAVFYVKDNGIGFDMRHVDKLFGVFQRLHRMEEFEGTGDRPGQRPPDHVAPRWSSLGQRGAEPGRDLLDRAAEATPYRTGRPEP